ncbi:MAG TPA: hypothetical protein VHL57_03490 [Flavobacteriales bacterium]|jgi:hypothetical protein|nr:hypothetical protein [Flavobacteriales bacterium]
MRAISLPLLLITSVLSAQTTVHIAVPAALDHAPDVRDGKGLATGLAAAGVPQDRQDKLYGYGDHALWPAGLATDSARAANAAAIGNYNCARVCTYLQDSLEMTVLELPSKENIHMPEDLRPAVDLYLLLPSSALAEEVVQRPTPSPGPRWGGLPSARITKPDELYATYDIASDSVARAALARYGMSDPEIDAVVFRSQERNWPEGIDTYEERIDRLKDFKRYKALVGARWDDKVLLIVPAAQNKQLPTRMRPCMDMYFVYAATAVKESGRR